MLNLKKKILKANLGTLALGSPNTHSSIVHSLLTLIFSQKEKKKKRKKIDCYVSKVVFFFSRCSFAFVKFKFQASPMKSYEIMVANS